jgi:transcription elongation factor GreA
MIEQRELVAVGSTVCVQDGDLIESWQIVDLAEADPKNRRISDASPLAKALLGRRAGDRVRVDGPRRWWAVTIMDVRAGHE